MMCFSKINNNLNYDCLFHSPYISFSRHYSSCPVSQCSKEIKDKDLNKMQSITLHQKSINQGFKSTSSANIKGKIFQYLQLNKLPIILICKTEKIMCNVYLWLLNTVLHEWVLKHRNKCMFALLIPSSQSQGVFEGAQDIFTFYSTAYNT